MKTIIVDDEPKAIELIKSYLAHFSSFELIATFRNGLKALEFLNKNEVNVIFLDINMPHLSGITLSKMISKETKIVFTTAYSEYAFESYDVDATDYLLKPISLERFSKTITKIIEKHTIKDVNLLDKSSISQSIFVKSGLETHQIYLEDINYLQKDGNYIFYFLDTKKIISRKSTSEALQDLNNSFVQIHRSYIVNFNKIDSISNEFVKIGTSNLPIGMQFKENLLDRLR